MSGKSKKVEAVGRGFFLLPTLLRRSKRPLLAGLIVVSK